MLLKLYLLLLDKYTPARHFYYNALPRGEALRYSFISITQRHKKRGQRVGKIGILGKHANRGKAKENDQ